MGRDPTPKKHQPRGPYDPPTPSEADQAGPEPFAVANDRQAQGESFKPTTAPFADNPFDEEVAEKYKMVPNANRGRNTTPDDTEAREQERQPPGFGPVNEDGYRQIDPEKSDET